MKPRTTIPIILLLASTCLGTKTLSQTPAQPPVLSAESTVVLVPALVRNGAGELVFTLQAKDFTVTDDGVEQKLRLDQDSDGQPLAMVVAIETGGAGARRLGDYRNLGPLMDAIIGDVQHSVAVIGFDSTPKVALDFTSNLNDVNQAIQGLRPGNQGASILDSLGLAVDLLRKQPPAYRRAILLISETVDRGSQLAMAEALRKISDTNTAIYSAAFSTNRADLPHDLPRVFQDDTPGPKGGCMSRQTGPQDSDSSEPDTADSDPSQSSSTDKSNYAPKQTAKQRAAQTYNCLSLLAPPLGLARVAFMAGVTAMRQNTPESVAHLTGGEYFQFKDERTLERDLATISNHVPNRYVLSFQPSTPHPGMHVIQLKLKEFPNLTVTARSSYWVDSETSPELRP